ncbi:MAG: hypothetical protein KAZ71_07470 [Bacteroidia bacterium]|nr:hypothetical protein [Bacteroidia bacterium]
MKKLNRFFVLFCLTSSLSAVAQNTNKGFKLDSQDNIEVSFLPQVLLSFDAIIVDKKVELTWASDTEHNNNFFTIEKSKDAANFETVATVKGFGNYSSLISYFDTDFTPYDGISYYRLKQTDVRGTVLSSRLVSINNKSVTNGLGMNVNAIDEHAENLMGSENKEVLVVLRNEKGMESYSKVMVDQQNNITVSSEEDNKLDNGTYTVIASSNNKLYSQKVVVR